MTARIAGLRQPAGALILGLFVAGIIILLTGGSKKRQQRDIDAAHSYWKDYKLGKRGRG